MPRINSDTLAKRARTLAIAFYVLMFMALVCALAGSPGSGFLLLLLGSCAHVLRVGLEALAPGQPTQKSRPSPRAIATSPFARNLADLRAKLVSKISA
jgi:hypothetical protein